MNKYMYSFLIIFIAQACAQKDFATKYNFADKSTASKKYKYTLTNTSEIIVDAPNNKMLTNNTTTVSFNYQMAYDTAGNKIITLTYNNFLIKIKQHEEDEEIYNSENVGEDASIMDKVLAAIKGNTIIITTNNNGNIVSTVGVKEITNKIASVIPNYNAATNEKVKQQLDELIGEKFIKNNIVQNSSLMPDSSISIGSTWSQKIDAAGEVPVDAVMNYTLQRVENGVGSIQSSAEFKTTIDKPINILGTTASTNLDGKITGTYKALEKSGFLVNATSNTNIEGSIIISNKEIPISIKIIKKLVAM